MRAERRLFLAEGPQAVREAIARPDCAQELFATPEALARHREIAAGAAAAGVEVRWCEDEAVAALAGSRTPQGLVAVCAFVDVALADALAVAPADARAGAGPTVPPMVAVGADLRDPGNAGSLLRCADAAGAGAVVLAGGGVDVYNDKVVRASAGSLFHLPVVVGVTLAEAAEVLRAEGYVVLAAAGEAVDLIDDLAESGQLARPVAWVFGNEAHGLTPEERAVCDLEVAIPIFGSAESLNVTAAAAVCLYVTAWAQRR